MSRTTKEQRAILSKVGSSDVQDLVQDLNEVEQQLDDATRALSETTEGFDAPHRIERADDHGGIYVWSDGHRHAYVPASQLDDAIRTLEDMCVAFTVKRKAGYDVPSYVFAEIRNALDALAARRPGTVKGKP